MRAGEAPGTTPGPASKAEFAREVTKQSLETLAEQLAQGNSAQLDAYLRAMGRFHQYSFNNIMLILAQKPDATQVAGFHAWRKLGRTVKRGEKGIAIFAPMLVKPKRKNEANPDGLEDEKKPQLRFRIVHVFDVSQTEGEPLPEPARVGGDPGEALSALEDAVRAAGIDLVTEPISGGADGMSSGGRITLRPDLSDAERFAVLAHEWAHELLHKTEDSATRPSKTVRETEAEAVAFVVSQSIRLETGTAFSDYIRLYQGEPETLAASLDRIQKAACVIIEAIQPDARREPAERATELEVRAAAAHDRRQR